MTSHFVKIQADKRVRLARIAKHDAYLVHEEPDGTLVYEPASAITETELELLQDTELMTQIAKTRRIPSGLRRRVFE